MRFGAFLSDTKWLNLRKNRLMIRDSIKTLLPCKSGKQLQLHCPNILKMVEKGLPRLMEEIKPNEKWDKPLTDAESSINNIAELLMPNMTCNRKPSLPPNLD